MKKAVEIVRTVKMKVDCESIRQDSIVSIIERCDDRFFRVKDKQGNVEKVAVGELLCFGIRLHDKRCFDIVSEGNNGNVNFVYARAHLTPRVRESDDSCHYPDYRLINPSSDYLFFEHESVDYISDSEVVKILLDDVLYGEQPSLQSQSLVASHQKGIDKNPNYHNGCYYLNNGKHYTMTCCKGVVKIREGLDGGWYAGGSTGNPIFEGKIDWQRYKKARIRKYAKELILFNSFWVENPQIFESIVEKVSQLDMFKLSSEL